MIDDRPFSTEFSHTRFLVPELMNYKGWALFLDADMIFTDDIAKLIKSIEPKYAIMCVKHQQDIKHDTSKMDGRVQQKYYRKNWSSFVLWNCGHISNRNLTREKVSYMKGADLHAFNWLKNEEIGSLQSTYNYISGVSPKLPHNNPPSVIHYTEGGPWFDICKNVPYADLWDKERRIWEDAGAPSYNGHLHVVEV